MYMTWEVFFLFCTLIVAVIRLVVDLHNNNKKRGSLISTELTIFVYKSLIVVILSFSATSVKV